MFEKAVDCDSVSGADRGVDKNCIFLFTGLTFLKNWI